MAVIASLFPLLERVHGHLAVLALALLVHPVVTLGRPALARWTLRSAELAALLLTASFALGSALYPTYRGLVKLPLLRAAPALVPLFETKEHLAFCATALALSGAAALRWGGAHADARQLARLLLAGAAACGITAGVLGVVVAAGAPTP